MINLPDIGLGCANLLEVNLPEFIDIAARHGFSRITARPYAFAKALRDGYSTACLQKKLKHAGIQVTMIDALTRGLPGVSAPSSLDEAARSMLPPDALDPPDKQTCLRAASTLGADILNVVAFLGKPVPVDQMAEAVSAICRSARNQGVQVGLEFVPDSGMPDLTFAQTVVEMCGEPNCGLTLDVFHLDRSGGTIAEVQKLPSGSIAGIQISDRVPTPPDAEYVPLRGRLLPGEGQLPLNELVTAALENSSQATIDIEVLNDELRELSPDETASRLAIAAEHWRHDFGRFQAAP